jgi:hypothetical protein
VAVAVLPRRADRWQVVGWIGTIAAAVVLSVATTSLIVGSRVDEQLAAQDATIAALEKVTTASLDIAGEPDAEHVVLAGVSDPSLDGSLAFSPSTTELVIVATGLTPPAACQDYRFWVEIAAAQRGQDVLQRRLAYWVGPVPAVSGLSATPVSGCHWWMPRGGDRHRPCPHRRSLIRGQASSPVDRRLAIALSGGGASGRRGGG